MSPCERFFDSRIVRRRSPIISIVSSPRFLNRFTHTAEPNHDTSDVGLLDITGGNARLSPDKAAKGTAARNAILSTERSLRIGFRTAAVISYAVPVLHPFPDVPQRVIQSKPVRLFLTDGMRRSTRIVSEPGDHIQRTIPAGIISATCRIFPLCLCGQAIVVSVPLAIDRLTKLLRVFPAHAFNRMVRSAGIARVGGHDRLILCLRDLVFAYLERPRDGYSMSRLFFGVAFMISG